MAIRSKKYLKFIRSQPCLVTGQVINVVAHHVRIGFFGAGMKPNDSMCLPLTDEQHRLLHQMGEKSYWERVGIDWQGQILKNLLIYSAKNVPPMRLLGALEGVLTEE
jgi:hypothetical protein